jgi:hypothetical protein
VRPAHARVQMRCTSNRYYDTRGMRVGSAATRCRDRPVAAAGSKSDGGNAAARSEISNSTVRILAASSTTSKR